MKVISLPHRLTAENVRKKKARLNSKPQAALAPRIARAAVPT
jgi:hypothetical protein